jgi:hypothetical protein
LSASTSNCSVEIGRQGRAARPGRKRRAHAVEVAQVEAVDDVDRLAVGLADHADGHARPFQQVGRQFQRGHDRRHAFEEPLSRGGDLAAVQVQLDQRLSQLVAQLALQVDERMQAVDVAGQHASARPAETGQQQARGQGPARLVEGGQGQHRHAHAPLALRALRLDLGHQAFDRRLHLHEAQGHVPDKTVVLGHRQSLAIALGAFPGHPAAGQVEREQGAGQRSVALASGFSPGGRRLASQQVFLRREGLGLQRLDRQPGVEQSDGIGIVRR